MGQCNTWRVAKLTGSVFNFYPLFSSEDVCVWAEKLGGHPYHEPLVLPASHSSFLGGEPGQ